jgi:hypothetical protein
MRHRRHASAAARGVPGSGVAHLSANVQLGRDLRRDVTTPLTRPWNDLSVPHSFPVFPLFPVLQTGGVRCSIASGPHP